MVTCLIPAQETAPAAITMILLHRRTLARGDQRWSMCWEAGKLARFGDLNGLHSAASVVGRATGTQTVSLLSACDCGASSVPPNHSSVEPTNNH